MLAQNVDGQVRVYCANCDCLGGNKCVFVVDQQGSATHQVQQQMVATTQSQMEREIKMFFSQLIAAGHSEVSSLHSFYGNVQYFRFKY